ncbi:hypothetical protein [Streptomyces sp. CAU 1734]|uniref:hypothetical protein n=1 Tax=Streptomyces sp. CAU 1734 TaxID=3140360 RepID=UPI00326199AA
MLITGGDRGAPGTALLIAAAPVGKGRLIDASSVLPALAAVPPSVLTGTEAATVIELADPLDPQTVLTRVRAAAAAEGPLFLFIAGQIQLDRKQRLPHLALARSTASTLRYTALPWHWLASELTVRRPDTTTVFVDLVADREAWQRIADDGLELGLAIRLYGRIAPPPARRGAAVPGYLAACAAIWRGGARPDPDALHERAAGESETAGALFLSGSSRFGPGTTPVPAAGAVSAASPGPAPGSAATAIGTGVAPGAGTTSATASGTGVVPRVGRITVPASGAGRRSARGARTATAPGAGTRPRGPAEQRPAAAPAPDPHPAILAAARAGRHGEAAAAAAEWERQETRAHGPGSAQAIHWLEVRADLARLAREPGVSCELWMTAAEARLTREQTADDPDVEGAVDRAHHQWEQIPDPVRARELAPRLVALRQRVPGRQRGALQVLRRRLENLHTG